MTVSRDIRLSVIAEVDQYVQAMKKIPGTTDKQAAAAGRALAKQLSKAEAQAAKSAEVAAKKASSSWRDSIQLAITPRDIAAAGRALGQLGQMVADLRNNLADMGARVGLSSTTLAGLKLAAEGSGQQLGDLETGVRGLAMRLNEAERGSKTAVDALGGIGITAEDIESKDLETLFRDAARGLQEIEDPGARARAAIDAMGRGGGRLMQALGSTELNEFVRRAELFGVDVGPQAAESAERWQRATADLNLALEGASTSLADHIGLTSKLENATTGLVTVMGFIGGVADNAKGALKDLFIPMHGLATGFKGLRDAWSGGTEAAEESARAWMESKIATGAARAAVDDLADSKDELADSTDAATDAAREYQQQQEELQRTLETAEDARTKIVKLTREMAQGELSAEEEIQAAYQRRLLQIEELALKQGEYLNMGELAAAQDAAAAEREAALGKLRDEQWRKRLEQEQEVLDLKAEIAEEEDKKNKERAAKRKREAEERLQLEQDLATAMIDLGSAVIDSVVQDEEKAHRLKQAAAAAQVLVDSAAAAVKTLMIYGPPIPPNPMAVASGLALGAVAAQTATSLMQIKKSAFDVGGVVGGWGQLPDNRDITAQDGEIVLDRATGQQLGRAGAEQLMGGGGLGGGPREVVVAFNDRSLDRMVSRVARGNSALRRLLRDGRRLGFAGVYS